MLGLRFVDDITRSKMATMSVKVMLVLGLVGILSHHGNCSMWQYFINVLDEDSNGVINGEEEMANLKTTLLELGRGEELTQTAIDMADTNWNEEIDATEYGKLRAGLLR
ncbi:hypothetical protein SNE40_006226 [Patella caerulea]|uniref:EF-hand domain-containing protein n=1 Tax=Patella caerulea TaxID=87958 RepID=A0AAN8Q481_PATCE